MKIDPIIFFRCRIVTKRLEIPHSSKTALLLSSIDIDPTFIHGFFTSSIIIED